MTKREPHIEEQSSYFNEKAALFVAPIPQDIQDLTGSIVASAKLSSTSRVLDVGTGAGVLIAHFLEEEVLPGNIVGCDLSSEMLSYARDRYPGVNFWQGDVVDLSSTGRKELPGHLKEFDAVFFNACFGNMWDQKETLTAAFGLLTPGGKIVISHPLGNEFVAKLHSNEPHIVPHLLPDYETVDGWRGELQFDVEHFEDRGNFYLVVLISKK